MFGSQCTFAGGATFFTVNTSTDFGRAIDPETGEIVGKLLYDIEVPDEESQTCFNIAVFQAGSELAPHIWPKAGPGDGRYTFHRGGWKVEP